MKLLTPRIHGAIDYVVVFFLLLSPTIFGLSHYVSTLTYGLGCVHLILTLFTNFEYGFFKIIPLSIHGWIELTVSVILIAAPWLLGFSENFVDRIFYMSFGVSVFATWLVTDY